MLVRETSILYFQISIKLSYSSQVREDTLSISFGVNAEPARNLSIFR